MAGRRERRGIAELFTPLIYTGVMGPKDSRPGIHDDGLPGIGRDEFGLPGLRAKLGETEQEQELVRLACQKIARSAFNSISRNIGDEETIKLFRNFAKENVNKKRIVKALEAGQLLKLIDLYENYIANLDDITHLKKSSGPRILSMFLHETNNSLRGNSQAATEKRIRRIVKTRSEILEKAKQAEFILSNGEPGRHISALFQALKITRIPNTEEFEVTWAVAPESVQEI